MSASTSKPFNYGGQAIIEGVMMRGAREMAVAVRNPQGEIVVTGSALNEHIYRGPLSRIPFLRGFTMLYDSLGIGMRALLYSANVAAAEALPEGEPDTNRESPPEIFSGPLAWGTVAFSLALGLGLFMLLPAALAGLLDGLLGITNSLVSNLIEGAVRLAILIGYIWAVGQMPDIRRLFAYHGAEHKTINAYEAGASLTPESVRRFSVEHPRCGTAFLLTVALLSVLLFAPLPRDPIWLRFATRLLLIPVLAGVSYEILRFTARHHRNPIVRILIAPNLALQHLTTREPDEQMLAVAIAALERVLAAEFAGNAALAPGTAPDTPLQSPSVT
jgi:uncharacterized protein YqhQ